MKQVLVSVIVPVYNVEQYLDQCVKSILDQDYENLEIILVDDGSTDSSGKMCDQWASRDKRIKVIHKVNGGLSDARNTGLKCAHGDYFCFIDSDDLVSEDFVSYLYQIINDYNVGIAACGIVHFFESRELNSKSDCRVRILTSNEAICEMLYQTSFLVPACGKLYRRTCFDNICFPVGMRFEDAAIMVDLFERAEGIALSAKQGYYYRHRADSITSSKFSPHDLDIIKIANKYLRRFKDSSLDLQRAAVAFSVTSYLRVCLNAPQDEKYKDIISNCEEYIKRHWVEVAMDSHARKKARVGAALFALVGMRVRKIYRRIPRWST